MQRNKGMSAQIQQRIQRSKNVSGYTRHFLGDVLGSFRRAALTTQQQLGLPSRENLVLVRP
jgi:hypothetical protein